MARTGQLLRVDAQFGLSMGGQRITGHQLLGDMPGQAGLQALGFIDLRQLVGLRLRRLGEHAALQREHRPLSVTLAAHGDVLSGCHGQRPGEQPRQARSQDRRPGRRGPSHADHQAGRRDDPVVGAQDGGAQPVEAGRHTAAVRLGMPGRRSTGQVHWHHCIALAVRGCVISPQEAARKARGQGASARNPDESFWNATLGLGNGSQGFCVVPGGLGGLPAIGGPGLAYQLMGYRSPPRLPGPGQPVRGR